MHFLNPTPLCQEADVMVTNLGIYFFVSAWNLFISQSRTFMRDVPSTGGVLNFLLVTVIVLPAISLLLIVFILGVIRP